MVQEKLNEILQLPEEEKIEIYEALHVDLFRENELMEDLTEWEIQELERRIKRIETGEDKLIPWEEVKKKYGMK